MRNVEYDTQMLRDVDLSEYVADPEGSKDILALLYFYYHVLGCMVMHGVEIQGFSIKLRGARVLLVIQGQRGDEAIVSYVTDKHAVACMRTWCRLLLEDRVPWHKDRYRT